MDLRPNGPLPALCLLALSAVLLGLAVNIVANANDPDFGPPPRNDGLDERLLPWGGACYVLSVLTGIASLVLWFRRKPAEVSVPGIAQAPLGPMVGLALAAREFIVRLHGLMLVVGVLVLAGGFGLVVVAAEYPTHDQGPAVGPFDGPETHVWGVPIAWWGDEVVVLGLAQIAIAMTFWASEFRWIRRLRAAWVENPPEV